MKNTDLYNEILSETNIFSAIYSLESYIFEKNLLSDKDLELFYILGDKHNSKLTSKTIKRCQKKLADILTSDNFFDIQVYFKTKKYDAEKDVVECRPMHTADLLTQICIVCILNVIMYKENKNGERELSDLSQLIPSNFYGNLPSTIPERIFYNWKDKYKEYSENVIRTYDDSKTNHSFKYEVTLDLKNFFPSINPDVIYNYILDKIGFLYKDNELKVLETALKKLLIFNVTNLRGPESDKKYYGDCVPTKKHSIGVPQGLPQSYYFGNICMILLAKEFDNLFPGKSFFYVDDSVIYTNSDNASDSKFNNSLKKLNKNIKNTLAQYKKGRLNDLQDFAFEVTVHTEEKSMSSPIERAEKMSKSFLMPIALEASRTSFEINNTIDTKEDALLKEKIDTLYKAVNMEINQVKSIMENNNDEFGKYKFDVYLKSLKRYKKFFLYRYRILEFRDSKDITEMKTRFEKQYLNNCPNMSKSDIERIFSMFDEEIFAAETQLIYNNIIDIKKKKEFKNAIIEFEKALIANVDSDNLYYKASFKQTNVETDSYATLRKVAQCKMPNFSKTKFNTQKNEIQKSINNADYIYKFFGYGDSYDKKIINTSFEYQRKILNAYYSRIFNFDISDKVMLQKTDGRSVKYYELRLFSCLRNKKCCPSLISEILNSICSENDFEKVNLSIYEVVNLFIKYVKNPKYVDTLILIHKYISGIWKNGSRFLYFYTLHNEEHSVELIKAIVKLSKVIDYFQLKDCDFYILFLSCYLHDISMVLQPSTDIFLQDNFDTDELCTQLISEKMRLEQEKTSEKENIKKLMKLSFEKVAEYFEQYTRDRHAYDSADFVRKSSDLYFVDDAIKHIVALISEAHAYYPNDVYGLKSQAKSENISEKYMKIFLRLADLLDGAKDRVSLNILKHNISNMPAISQFHWVTHAVTDEISIDSQYYFEEHSNLNRDYSTVLKKENLHETIVFEIKLNASNLTAVKTLSCSNCAAKLDVNNEEIVINLKNGSHCTCKECNFLCKWLMRKNCYLKDELIALQTYLDRNNNNLFNTRIILKLNFKNSSSLSDTYYDIVNKQIQ